VSGYSGLSYMLKLGVDIIKIDKMFVDAFGTDRNSTTIVETLVDLACSPSEKGRPCGRPVKTPRGRNLVRVGLSQAGPRDRIR